MKKIICLLLLVSLCFVALVACDTPDNGGYYFDGDIDFDDSHRPVPPPEGGDDPDRENDQEIGENNGTVLPYKPIG